MRVGFAGLGYAARSFHLPPLTKLEGVELVGGYDPDLAQRTSWPSQKGGAAYETLEELGRQARPDLLVVATPPQSHASICVQAVEAGMHVFCEKPFVMDVGEADRVIAAADAADRRVAVNHEFREMPVFSALHKQITSGDSGRLVFCQIWQLMDLKPWEEPVAWRAAMPDRTLFEGGVHLVDLLLMFFGELPEAVSATRSSGLDPDRDADAIHLVTFEFPGGRLAQLTIDRLCPSGTRYVEVRADCEQASLRASAGGRAVAQIGMKRAERAGLRVDFAPGGLAWSERGLRRRTLARNGRQAGTRATGLLVSRVIDSLRAGHDPPSSAREARDVLRVIEAAYTASHTGQRVKLEPSSQVA
jgi:predicted dehydrogenase